jgi:hypothetical protein
MLDALCEMADGDGAQSAILSASPIRLLPFYIMGPEFGKIAAQRN